MEILPAECSFSLFFWRELRYFLGIQVTPLSSTLVLRRKVRRIFIMLKLDFVESFDGSGSSFGTP